MQPKMKHHAHFAMRNKIIVMTTIVKVKHNKKNQRDAIHTVSQSACVVSIVP